ncbi:MAG: hypothetical protein VX824_05620 [Pseudomonadota bacterium]|nr:hypothetical protein [Pseudomonadota bacterium]
MNAFFACSCYAEQVIKWNALAIRSRENRGTGSASVIENFMAVPAGIENATRYLEGRSSIQRGLSQIKELPIFSSFWRHNNNSR